MGGNEISRRILVLRGHRVILSPDLAELYGVETKALVQAVKRNGERFPEDFMFQLTVAEFGTLRSQIVTSKPRDVAAPVTDRSPSLSRALRCSRACSEALEPLR